MPMGLLHALQDVANHVGLIKVISVTEETQTTTHVTTTRTVTLSELTTELQGEEMRTLAEMPAELSVAFEQVFAAAGVKAAAHGWDLGKLEQTLASPEFKDKPHAEIQKALAALLAAQKVPVEDLVKDAMARDQAIDAFGKFVHQKVLARKAIRAKKVTDIENQIADLRSQANELQQEDKADHELWVRWWARKLACEKQMAASVSSLLDKPVVTIDEALPSDNNLG